MAEMGCNGQYNRHWDVYNRELVMRGEVIFDLSWISGYCDEIEAMNRGKRGHPFEYGESLISYVCKLKAVTKMAFRLLEGFLRTIFDAVGIDVPRYSTLWERCNVHEASAGVPADARKRIAAGDSTGEKVTVRGSWMREKWKIHKGWLKLHLLTDVETNEILSFKVTDERSGDSKHLPDMVDSALADGHDVEKVMADGAYDTRDNWNGMKRRKIEFVTNIRKNASARSKGCTVRAAAVRERNEIGNDAWKEKKGYNMRWKVESAISDLKRMFGESVSSKTFANMEKEIGHWIECFNIMKAVKV